MAKPHTPVINEFRKRVRGQLSMLTVQFLLGMGVNLIGLPSEASGGAKAATTILLVLHILISIGLFVGVIITIRQAKLLGDRYTPKTWLAGSLVIGTIIAGMLTAGLENDWWSYIMAVGFIASFVIYWTLYSSKAE